MLLECLGVVVGSDAAGHSSIYRQKETRNGRTNAVVELTGEVSAAGTPANLPSIALTD